MALKFSFTVHVFINSFISLNLFLNNIVLCNLTMQKEYVTISLPGLGKVSGVVENTYWSEREFYSFYGIHYGESTSGQNRYMPPIPRKPWQENFNATRSPKICPQAQNLEEIKSNPEEDYEDCLTLNVFSPTPPIPRKPWQENFNATRSPKICPQAQNLEEIKSNPEEDYEDCLTLNVFSPTLPENDDKKMPVMVYIHGGGFYEGSANKFPPHYLLDRDVVLVVIQYRLGPFGFLSLHTETISGNVAFLDQVLALEWVQENIKHFNGDAKRVTVFGQSAGAASISLLLQSPVVRPELFHQAILQSGAAFGTWVVDNDPKSYGLELASTVQKEETVQDVITAENILRNASVVDILMAATNLRLNSAGRSTFGGINAVVQCTGDVRFLPQPVAALTATQRAVPMILGVTAHEGSFIAGYVYDALAKNDLQNDDAFLRKNLTSIALSAMLIDDVTGAIEQIFRQRYFDRTFLQKENIKFQDISAGLIDMMGVLAIKAPVWRAATINSRTACTRLYSLQWRGRDTRFGYGEDTTHLPFDGGAAHSDDLLYLFPWPYLNEDGPLGGAGSQNEIDTSMSKTMVDLWTSFAINGEPKSDNIEWPCVKTGGRGPYLLIKPNHELGQDFEAEQYTVAMQEDNRNPV